MCVPKLKCVPKLNEIGESVFLSYHAHKSKYMAAEQYESSVYLTFIWEYDKSKTASEMPIPNSLGK